MINETETLRVTIEASPEQVSADLADPTTHPMWATEFFEGQASGGPEEGVATVPMMGGKVRMRADADVSAGVIDLYLAPIGAPYGPPLPVRVIPNGDGSDVLWTLARPGDMPDVAWQGAQASMQRELENLKRRHEV